MRSRASGDPNPRAGGLAVDDDVGTVGLTAEAARDGGQLGAATLASERDWADLLANLSGDPFNFLGGELDSVLRSVGQIEEGLLQCSGAHAGCGCGSSAV